MTGDEAGRFAVSGGGDQAVDRVGAKVGSNKVMRKLAYAILATLLVTPVCGQANAKQKSAAVVTCSGKITCGPGARVGTCPFPPNGKVAKQIATVCHDGDKLCDVEGFLDNNGLISRLRYVTGYDSGGFVSGFFVCKGCPAPKE